MNLFFLIQSLQLLIFYMDDQELVTNLAYDFYVLCFTRSLLVPYVYVSIESIDCIILSSFELKAILSISPVKTLFLLLLNLCCVSYINLLFFMNSV